MMDNSKDRYYFLNAIIRSAHSGRKADAVIKKMEEQGTEFYKMRKGMDK